MLDSICRATGIKCGLYTSPHLVSITERITFSGTQISPEEFASCVTTVRDVSAQLLNDKQLEALPTFFEQLTVAALLAFRNARVELAILETGLGGRLDSTTAAKASIVAITPIAMDHEEYLGDTLESIAAEKAAIIRPGVQAVIAKQDPVALRVLLRRCEETGVTPILDTDMHGYERVRLGLRGRHQIQNAGVAIRLAELLNIPDTAIVTGLETATHPGRLELIEHEPAFLIDGAHNPAGAKSLRDYLDEFAPRPLTLVFGAMRDKQLEQMGEILFPCADTLILTTIKNPRSASIERLREVADHFARGKVMTSESSETALRIAETQTPSEGLICIAGSLYLVGELRPLILSRSQEPI
jgi:dihydrofolate synthase/folylpolyglutamate synthase